jgi:demethylspheroidene O-methyltransferase
LTPTLTVFGPELTVFDAWVARLSASARWQRWAFSTPFVRNVARRRALDLFDLCAGFVHSQVLSACVELDLFARLMVRPCDAETVARESGLSLEGAKRLLDAAAALGLLSVRGGRYGIGPLGGPLAEPGSGIAAMVAHHGRLYADLAEPLTVFRGGGGGGALNRFWSYAEARDGGGGARAEGGEHGAGAGESGGLAGGGGGAEAARPYSALMAASQDFVAADVLDALRGKVSRGGRWLDLGGGDGRFLAEAARRDRRLTGAVLDLPPVADLARARFAAAGLAARLRALPGDARDPAAAAAAAPCDVACLIRVLHDHDDPSALAFLRAARAALAPAGRLIVAEPMRGPPSDPRISDAYFGPYLLAMGQGRLRHPAEIAALAANAGFAPPREAPTRRPFLTRALIFECQIRLTD